jgi:hypothetical protein
MTISLTVKMTIVWKNAKIKLLTSLFFFSFLFFQFAGKKLYNICKIIIYCPVELGNVLNKVTLL